MALILAATAPVRVIVNQSSDWPIVIVGVVGVIGTLVAAIGAVLVTQRWEDRRWNAQQVSLANTARADRLRDVYGRMAQAAGSLRVVVGQRSFVLEGESIEERNARHERNILDAMNRVAEVGGQILVESSAKPVRDAYSTLTVVVQQYMIAEKGLPPGADRAKQLTALVEAVMAMADKVVALATGHLAELERPAQVGAKVSRTQKEASETGEHATPLPPARRTRFASFRWHRSKGVPTTDDPGPPEIEGQE